MNPRHILFARVGGFHFADDFLQGHGRGIQNARTIWRGLHHLLGFGNIRPLTGYIGAEIAGMDLRSLDEDGAHRVRQALLEHQVLFFPRQESLSPDQLLAVGERFGDIDPPHGGLEPHPDNPKVMVAVSRNGETLTS